MRSLLGTVIWVCRFFSFITLSMSSNAMFYVGLHPGTDKYTSGKTWWNSNKVCILVNSMVMILISCFWWSYCGYGRCSHNMAILSQVYHWEPTRKVGINYWGAICMQQNAQTSTELNVLFLPFFKNWSMIHLQCHAGFSCIAEWLCLIHKYVHIYTSACVDTHSLPDSFPCKLLWNTLGHLYVFSGEMSV